MDQSRSENYPLLRRPSIARLLRDRGELLVVSGLGAPSWDTTSCGDTPLNFPLWGAMGGAAMVGLGLALAQPQRRVLVITGDGEMLMGLGGLATIGVKQPRNLAVVVVDNERYGETGMQATHTAFDIDLAGIAAAAGIARSGTLRNEADLEDALPQILGVEGPVFFAMKVRAEDLPLVMPPKDGVVLKERFRAALLGAVAES